MDRPAHPHVHALLSPRFENRMPVHLSPVRIQRIKERWEREILAGLKRQERRLDRAREALSHSLALRPRERVDRRIHRVLPVRATPGREGQLELFVPARRSVRAVRGSAWVRQWFRLGRRRARWQEDPERAVSRAVFRLATKAMPTPIREVLWQLRGLRGIGLRHR